MPDLKKLKRSIEIPICCAVLCCAVLCYVFAAAEYAVDVLDDPRCIELMKMLQTEKPDLWAEDIGG